VLRSTCGRPGEVVCRIAEEVDAAYVVIGDDLPSEGMGRMWRAVVGGTGGNLTGYLLHHITCPIILVRDLSAYQQPRSEDRRRRFSGDAIHGLTNRLRRIRFASGSAGTGMTTLRCTDVSAVSIGSEQCELVNEGGDAADALAQDPDTAFKTWTGQASPGWCHLRPAVCVPRDWLQLRTNISQVNVLWHFVAYSADFKEV